MRFLSLIRRAYAVLLKEGVTSLILKTIKFLLLRGEIVLALLLGYIFPRNKDVIVFANSSEKCEFSGNMKYLFLELANEYDKYCIWMTKYDEIEQKLSDRGYNVCKTNSLRARLHLLRAEYAVTDVDFNNKQWSYLFSATTIQLWHAYPLKNFPKQERGTLGGKIQVFDYACLNNSVEEAELRNHKNINKTYYTGYPRNDIFFRNIRDAELGVDTKMKRKLDQVHSEVTVIGYFPTWRENEDIDPLEPDKFNTFLKEHNAHCVIKPHRYTTPFIDDSEFDRIHVHPPTGDIYPLFEEIDILLTDYSSIYFDYLFIDRPVAFYPYDYEKYTEIRGLNLNYDCVTPGPKSYTFDELLSDLSDLISDDGYKTERKEILNEVFSDYDGNATNNIYKMILQ